jgi:hypothetical protein
LLQAVFQQRKKGIIDFRLEQSLLQGGAANKQSPVQKDCPDEVPFAPGIIHGDNLLYGQRHQRHDGYTDSNHHRTQMHDTGILMQPGDSTPGGIDFNLNPDDKPAVECRLLFKYKRPL